MGVNMTGLVSGLDTESIVKELMAAQKLKQTKIVNKQTTLEWTQEKWKELNTKIYKFYTESVSKMRLQGSYITKKVTTSNDDIATGTANDSAANGLHTLEVKQLASSQYITGKVVSDMNASTKLTSKGVSAGTVINITSGTGSNVVSKSLIVDDNTTVSTFLQKVNEAGINATYDATQGRFFISSKESGAENQFTITSSNANLTNIGLTEINDAFFNTAPGENGVILQDEVALVKATNSIINLDGAELTGTTNNFTAAGITFNLLNKTAIGQSVSLTVNNDNQATYDMIKEFVTNYNTLLDEMNTLYYADSARGYDPLTDEQKEAMTDDQIEKWETKIKDSLLRRDSKLDNLITSIKNTLSSTVKIGDKNYSLSTYGIQTSTDYSEKGLLHIWGDAKDSTYSLKEDKLMAAIEDNPEQLAETFTGIVGKLFDTMNDKMKSSSLKSALTFYNDKQITKQLTDYKKEISDWDDRLSTLENRYYKQFTAMESALQKLQTQSSSITGLLGTTSS